MRKYSKLVLYNLFECYSTDSHFIIKDSKMDFDSDDFNDDCEQAKDIIVAWGTDHFKSEKEDAMKKLVKYKDKLKCFTDDVEEVKTFHPLYKRDNAYIVLLLK